jgi:hypothetical protein
MEPNTAIGHAIKLASQAISKGGKPASIKLKVKFDSAKKVGAIKKRASRPSQRLSDKEGVTR